MKKIIVFTIFCLAILYAFAPAQEIYQTSNSSKKYLSLGEIDQDTNQYRLLDLETLNTLWLNKNELKQVDLLNPNEFFNFIKQHELTFNLEGYAPFWKAHISKNKLMIETPELSKNTFSIQIDIDKHPIDNVFLLSFKSHNAEIYGFIRKLTDHSCGNMLTEHDLMFETFINIQETPYKGCAYIDKANL